MVVLTRKLHTDRPPLTHEFLIPRLLSSPSLWGRQMGTNGSCSPSPTCFRRVSLTIVRHCPPTNPPAQEQKRDERASYMCPETSWRTTPSCVGAPQCTEDDDVVLRPCPTAHSCYRRQTKAHRLTSADARNGLGPARPCPAAHHPHHKPQNKTHTGCPRRPNQLHE
jgi:hypothetical protein